MAAPYRLPLWAALSRHSQLTVALLTHDRRIRNAGRRPDDWQTDTKPLPYQIRQLRTVAIAYREDFLHILITGLHLLRERPTAILIGGWDSPAYWQALALAKLLHIRAVGFYESTLNSNKFTAGPISWARKVFFQHLDAAVVPGAAARTAVSSLGVPESRIYEGFNAVDVARFHVCAAAARSASEARGHRFLYVGQLIARKNLTALLNAYALIRNAGDSLTLLGTGPEREALIHHARQLGDGESITFIDHIANLALPSFLAGYETLVLASWEEVWGLVVNEALATGMHAVVSHKCGVYASVKTMPGVYGCEIGSDSIAAAMVESRAQWTGWIDEPTILSKTPEEFASVFATALGL